MSFSLFSHVSSVFCKKVVFSALLLGCLIGVSAYSTVLADSPSLSSVNGGLSAAARGGGLGDFCNGQRFGTCVAVLVGGVIQVLIELSGCVLLGYILYAGFLWMTSGGETEKAKEARVMIFNAVVGLIIVMTAFAISSFVLTSLNRVADPAAPSATEASAPSAPTP
jgi:hypothetical protein